MSKARGIVEGLIQEIAVNQSGYFKPGDILLPKFDPAATYPENAYHVVKHDEEGLQLSPLGGGQIGTARNPSEWRKVDVEAEKSKRELLPARFAIEDGPEYPGYHYGERWNGWAKPYFTKEVAERILRDGQAEWAYDPATDSFTVDTGYGMGENEADVYRGEDIQGMRLYPIGAGSWIWDEVNGDDEGADEHDM